MDAVDVVSACHIGTEFGEIVARLSLLGVHIALLANLDDEIWELLPQLLAAQSVPLAYGDGDNPRMTLHTALVALIDTELQGIVAWRRAWLA